MTDPVSSPAVDAVSSGQFAVADTGSPGVVEPAPGGAEVRDDTGTQPAVGEDQPVDAQDQPVDAQDQPVDAQDQPADAGPVLPDLEPEAGGPVGADPVPEAGGPAHADPEPEAGGRAAPVYETEEWRGIVLVTGTDTEVGKTVVTAAITAAASAAGLRVAVVKPGQTGTDAGPSDVDTVVRLAGPATARTLSTFPDPLAPLAAARIRGMAPLELYTVVDAVRAEAMAHDLVLVEGAGGLLVPMGLRPSGQPWTLADLAVSLGAPAVVVVRAGLGTLNHTALTLEALDRRGVPAGVVLGAWPAEPGLVHWANFTELVPNLMGALPAGAGGMDPGVFRRSAPGWLTPRLFGVLDDWRAWADET